MIRPTPPLALLIFCTLALASPHGPAEDDGAAAETAQAFPWVELPDGPVAKAWAGVGETTVPASLGEEFPAARLAEGSAWSEPATWKLWSEWLTSDPSEDRAARRAGLALLALEQGRSEDAWQHFAACSESPEWMARLMPSLLPGVPIETELLASGRVPQLENAALLRPSIPSIPTHDSGMVLARSATVRDLRVGEAVFDMKVTFDSYGVQLDFEWKSGGTAEVNVLIPEPDGFEIRVEYVDWMRQKKKRVPHRVELSEAQPQMSLFARIRSTRALYPGIGSGPFPRELERAGLWIEHSANDPELELLEAAARAASAALGFPVRLREAGQGSPAPNRPVGHVLHLTDPGPERERQLAWLASALERTVLEGRKAGK